MKISELEHNSSQNNCLLIKNQIL